ncbi:MAG: rpoE 4 [Gemmataceae bacterium]|nr:rpoE 4 [Gemmataceae bacterium]
MGWSLIGRLLRAQPAEPGESVSDTELLARYVRTGDQSAFELLVWRHAVMVAGVCRRIIPDEHLAEDAFQAAFLVLARKAGSVRGGNLAGWLYRVARRVAHRARCQTMTWSRRETPLTAEPVQEPARPPFESRELLAILD